MRLLLDTVRQSYNGESHCTVTFDLELHLKVKLKTAQILRAYIEKRGELGHVLPMNTNRKPYMGTPMEPSHLTLISKPYIL